MTGDVHWTEVLDYAQCTMLPEYHAPPTEPALLALSSTQGAQLAGGDTETRSGAAPVNIPAQSEYTADGLGLSTTLSASNPATARPWQPSGFKYAGIASFGLYLRTDPGAQVRLHCACSIGSNTVRSTRRIVTQRHAFLQFLRPPPATFIPSTEFNLQRLEPAPVALLVDQFGDLMPTDGVLCRASVSPSPAQAWWEPTAEALQRGAVQHTQIQLDVINQPQAGIQAGLKAAMVAPRSTLSSATSEPNGHILLPNGTWIPSACQRELSSTSGNSSSTVDCLDAWDA